jgi:hypothetical protein
MGLNGMVFFTIFDVFVILMTKKCTKNNIFATGSIKNQGGPPTLSPKIRGGDPKSTYDGKEDQLLNNVHNYIYYRRIIGLLYS